MKDVNIVDDAEEYDDDDTIEHRYMTFKLQNEQYGVGIVHVTEIISVPPITQVPDLPDFVKGVINLRGRVIPVLDLRMKFRLPPREYDGKTCVIVVNVNKLCVGLIVDTVDEVREILPESVSATPQVASTPASQSIKGLGKFGNAVCILLDVNLLLDVESVSPAVVAQEPALVV